MEQRYFYEVGMRNETMIGYVMGVSHKEAVSLIVKHLDDLGITDSDVEYLNVNHDDNDDILGMQYDEFRVAKGVMRDALLELGVSPSQIKNNNCQLSPHTSQKLIEILKL